MKLKILSGIVLFGMFFSCSLVKQSNHVPVDQTKSTRIPVDTSKKNLNADTARPPKPRPYKEVVTKKASSDPGLFIFHKVEERYLIEIPNNLLNREILVVNRIAKAAAGIRRNMVLGFGGDQIGEKVILFTKGPDHKLLIKQGYFRERSIDSSENGMYRPILNSNLWPIIGAFDIKAYTEDFSASVIDITDFLLTDNELVGFDPAARAAFQLNGLQKDRSYVLSIKSFPINMEIQSVNSYIVNGKTATYEVNNSFVLLPEKPMSPRFRDERVGYFYRAYLDFDLPQKVNYTHLITRWRLEPREADKERYLQGELVEPGKPIVFYIDPATPKKWIPYLIQGVNDWQKAFEKAGFKKAIYALEAPANDPEWSLLDARHSAIVYKASDVKNASGPNVNDPRTGEILESHINWYHNIMEILHDWYMIQAGPNDPQARKMIYSDSLMGRLIRYVVCHEVGHTLGLMHNFGASWTIPVDSLRDRNFVKKNGFCPSIMDYARFNYVAQPEDGFTQEELMPRIGVYDEWAIEWGYRWTPQLKTKDQEKAYWNQWVINSLNKNKHLWYGPQDVFNEIVDPRAQYEDIGDDAIRAGNYAIKNLKLVYANLMEWTKEPNGGYESMLRMQQNIFVWFKLYLTHVKNNIGLFETTEKTVEQKGTVISFVSKEKQKDAVQFLHENIFQTPEWLLNKQIMLRTKLNPYDLLPSYHLTFIHTLVNNRKFIDMEYFRLLEPEQAYSFDELLTDLENGIFSELNNKSKIDFFRRNLQTILVERLINEASTQPTTSFIENNERTWKFGTGYMSIVRSHVDKMISKIEKTLLGYKDEESKYHLKLLYQRLKQANIGNAMLSTPEQNEGKATKIENSDNVVLQKYWQLNCWQVPNFSEEWGIPGERGQD